MQQTNSKGRSQKSRLDTAGRRRQGIPPRDAPILGRMDLWIQGIAAYFLSSVPRALEFHGRSAESFGKRFVEVRRLRSTAFEHGEHVQGDVSGDLGLLMRFADDRIVLAEIAVAGDRGEGFHQWRLDIAAKASTS